MIRDTFIISLIAWKLGLLDFAKKGVDAVSDSVNGYPTNYDSLFQLHGKRFGVDWKLLKRIAIIESNLGRAKSVAHGLRNPSDVEGSKSSDGKSWGLMQVTLPTAQWLDKSATVEKLNDPNFSVYLAAKFFEYLQDYFPKTDARYWEWVVKSYNQGQGNTAKERAGTSTGFAHAYWAKYLKLSQEF